MTDSSFIDDIKAQFKDAARASREEEAQRKLREELANVCAKDLAHMSETELAAWQSKYPNSSPQATLAAFEWQRRLTAMQVKSARFAAWLGLLGVIVGGLLAYAVTKWFPH